MMQNDEMTVRTNQNVQFGIIAQRFICYYSKKGKRQINRDEDIEEA
jgi:hypothetical protein